MCIRDRLLAEEVGADALMILTEVEKVAVNFNKPNQEDIAHMTYAEAEKHCEDCLLYTSEKLACIAQNIIAEQTESIRDMRRALCCCCNSINSCRDLCEYKCRINCIIKEMFEEMKCAYIDNSIECNFIRTMIPHHKGAIRMAKMCIRDR